MRYLEILNPTNAGAVTYIPKFNAITDNPSTCDSDPVSANVINERVEIIGVIVIFTASLNNGFSLSQSAITGENECKIKMV